MILAFYQLVGYYEDQRGFDHLHFGEVREGS